MKIQKTQAFKTIALLLCIAILFATVIPQAQAGWGFWKCLGLKTSYWAALAAAVVICSVPDPSIIGCSAAWALFFFLVDLHKAKCK